jgi:uncharacterized protein with PIN domain
VSKHARKTAGTVAMKRCPVCHRDVLSAYRGEVTAVGQGRILSVSRTGEIIGECGGCGRRVIWEREVSRDH